MGNQDLLQPRLSTMELGGKNANYTMRRLTRAAAGDVGAPFAFKLNNGVLQGGQKLMLGKVGGIEIVIITTNASHIIIGGGSGGSGAHHELNLCLKGVWIRSRHGYGHGAELAHSWRPANLDGLIHTAVRSAIFVNPGFAIPPRIRAKPELFAIFFLVFRTRFFC